MAVERDSRQGVVFSLDDDDDGGGGENNATSDFAVQEPPHDHHSMAEQVLIDTNLSSFE